MHIATKGTDEQYYNASESMYVSLFEAYHRSLEAMVDAGIKDGIDWKTARKWTYSAIDQAKLELEKLVETNKDIAVDNVLRGLVEDIWFQLGTARSLLLGKEVEIKDKEPTEEPWVGGPANEEEYMMTMWVEK